ncbi:DUF6542 domain-containing protein [Streptomyces albireticuli]|uniref:DUF6542 domain-containing protein n=1 Tax=Streptomyces albireticuli TaxID=1940 RepID=A0A2A2D9K4_9ACTN|nr:DUF6542 domain-containing protein [Streptomyces albireticuli]MCD9142629.1 hypothetical protein [Streptomyces albireticuli]MCD9164028.1 hypothetical protein [Streptomyces albireticuli]MCD9192757.1 hypothetical protein [Streptomyces albireticuli]PAU48116.1 hypothetical protein CK936_15085 [Streptomyces albireticuli]
MEQPSTRIPQRKARRASPVPRPSAPVGPGESPFLLRGRSGRASPPPGGPGTRLTGLGSGLLTILAMIGAGWLDSVMAGGSTTLYGMAFLLGAAACALWVRPADLVTAPVTAPIAFTAGAVPLTDGDGGFAGQAMGMITLLSLNAGWLYAGTLLAGALALVRRIMLVRARRKQRNRQRRRPSRPPRSPRRSGAEQARSRR